MVIDHKQTYEDFIDDVAITAGVDKKIAHKIIRATFECIKGSVTLDEQVRIPKFGSFSPVDRPERKIKSIKTGSVVIIPPCRGIKFLPSKLLIAAIQDVKI